MGQRFFWRTRARRLAASAHADQAGQGAVRPFTLWCSLLTAAGQVWTFGSGKNGKLGHGGIVDRRLPTVVEAGWFGDGKIVYVAAGGEHSVTVNSEGSVWTCGGGMHGCLGHTDEQERLVPTQLGDVSKVVMVAAGRYHTVAVSDRVLYVWDYGAYGGLGLGDDADRLAPVMVAVEAFGGYRVLVAACGDYHTLVVSENGAMWSCDNGNGGGWPRQQALVDRFVPTCISAQHFGNAKIVSAAAGWSDHNEFHMWSQSSAVTELGALYTWGRGLDLGPGEPVVRCSLVPCLSNWVLGSGDATTTCCSCTLSPSLWARTPGLTALTILLVLLTRLVVPMRRCREIWFDGWWRLVYHGRRGRLGN